MFDTISIGTSGLLVHSKGLRVVGNNLANVNTPGFKSAQLQFANLFEQNGGAPAQANSFGSSGTGTGVQSIGTQINFRAGLDQSTGNPLDLNINGNGFFAVKRDGDILYTRSGEFRFDDKGALINASGDHVQSLDNGKLVDLTIDKFGRSMPKATSTVKFRGNLSSTLADPAVDAVINGISVIDANGSAHELSLSFKDNGAGKYTVSVKNKAGTVLATGPLNFTKGFPDADANQVGFSFTPPGGTSFQVKFDFSENVQSVLTPTTLALSTQDGYAAGVKTDQTIDADGVVTLFYSNGQNVKGPRVALANFDADSDLEQGASSTFTKKANVTAHYGFAGTDDFGKLAIGHREGSNVDLAEEFGNLILMQRGYQASSHVISTANDMIQQLFDMKGR